jgi:CheY-like chemotaxis protein
MKKVLIIEDDAVTAKVYATLLTKHGFQVEVAGTIRTGLDQLATFQPDGILLDLMLPDSNGLEFLKRLRAADSYKALPVVVYTNVFVPGMTERATAAGASKVFDKTTVTPTSFIDTFNQLLSPAPVKEAA